VLGQSGLAKVVRDALLVPLYDEKVAVSDEKAGARRSASPTASTSSLPDVSSAVSGLGPRARRIMKSHIDIGSKDPEITSTQY